MTIYEELKIRNAQVMDWVLCEKGVFVVTCVDHVYTIMGLNGAVYFVSMFDTVYNTKDFNFLQLMRPHPDAFDKKNWDYQSKKQQVRFDRIDPVQVIERNYVDIAVTLKPGQKLRVNGKEVLE